MLEIRGSVFQPKLYFIEEFHLIMWTCKIKYLNEFAVVNSTLIRISIDWNAISCLIAYARLLFFFFSRTKQLNELYKKKTCLVVGARPTISAMCITTTEEVTSPIWFGP